MSRICALGAIFIALALGGRTAVAEAIVTPPATGPELQGPTVEPTTRPNEDGGQAPTEPGAGADANHDALPADHGLLQPQASSDDELDDRHRPDEPTADLRRRTGGDHSDGRTERWRLAGDCDERGDEPGHRGDDRADHRGDDRGCEELGGSKQQAGDAQPEEPADGQASGDLSDGAPSEEQPDGQASGEHSDDAQPEEQADGQASDQLSDDAPAAPVSAEHANPYAPAAGETPPAAGVEGVSDTPLEQVPSPAAGAARPVTEVRPPRSRSPKSPARGRRSRPQRRPSRSRRPPPSTPKQGSHDAAREPRFSAAGGERRAGTERTGAVPAAVAAAPRSNPGLDAVPGLGAATAVPNLVIERFRIPIFLLPIYQAAGIEYGVRWEVLAAINEVETNYGRNLNVSSAGAMGWMQFIPSSWRAFGVDGNEDGRRDPYNPVDAIFAAANYLERAGAEKDLRRAIYAYNHADWYVDMVLERARAIAAIPAGLVGSLTGLTEGRFPVGAAARYGGATPLRGARGRVRPGKGPTPTVARDRRRAGVEIFSRLGAPVLAVNDGVVKRIGHSGALGRYVILQDVNGNRFRFSRLGRLSRVHRAMRPAAVSGPETGSTRTRGRRLRPHTLRRGSRVLAGTVLGRVGAPRPGRAPHFHLAIRPAGRSAPRVDPRPILDGWRLLRSTAIYRADGRSALRPDGGPFSLGQVLLLPKPLLERRVLADSRIELYSCGRRDVRSGHVDRRVLAALTYLAESGLSPTVSSLKCGHSFYTRSGRVSHHSSGNAVDISAVNGVPVLGHQGAGDVTEQTVRRLLALQGSLRPDQVISLLDLGAPAFAMGDHHDHIHVGFRPLFGADRGRRRQARAVLRPRQWHDLLDRLDAIANPRVSRRPSRDALRARP